MRKVALTMLKGKRAVNADDDEGGDEKLAARQVLTDNACNRQRVRRGVCGLATLSPCAVRSIDAI